MDVESHSESLQRQDNGTGQGAAWSLLRALPADLLEYVSSVVSSSEATATVALAYTCTTLTKLLKKKVCHRRVCLVPFLFYISILVLICPHLSI